MTNAQAWARVVLLQELRELFGAGHACNVQQWSREGAKKRNAAACSARRREARKLLRLAIRAVTLASR